MPTTIQKNQLTELENAIHICFGNSMEDYLPQVETEEDAIVDLLQDSENLTREEAEYFLHHTA